MTYKIFKYSDGFYRIARGYNVLGWYVATGHLGLYGQWSSRQVAFKFGRQEDAEGTLVKYLEKQVKEKAEKAQARAEKKASRRVTESYTVHLEWRDDQDKKR